MTTDNLVSEFFKQCREYPDDRSFYYFSTTENNWVSMNWREYHRQVSILATWLSKEGVGPGDRVAIFSANRPEWMIGDMAVLALGAVSIPIYATSSKKDVQYITEHSGAKIFLVDHVDRAKMIDETKLEKIIFFDKSSQTGDSFMGVPSRNLSDILATERGDGFKPAPIHEDDIATIIYTSGTTGSPKGVVHTHGNFDKAARVVMKSVTIERGDERFFSFLPLSHVAERVLIQLSSIYTGCEVSFARSVANLAEDLVHCRPTILLCVPRLWEKMYEKIQAQLMRAPLAKRLLFAFAKKLGSVRIRGDEVFFGMDQHMFIKLSNTLVGNALRKKLGLDRVKLLLTGSAPTRSEVLGFFASFGLIIREVYGLTENLCLGVFHNDKKIVMGSCGQAFIGNEIRIASDGEILFRAPWMFKGYYKNDEASREVLSSDGWFNTGDLGKLDDDGYLRIVGRKKELLKTSTGKYVAPVPIEDRLKSLPGIDDAMVIGDNQKYCIALISLETEENSVGENFDELIKTHISSINVDLANHESIKRVGILSTGFSVADGTLTPTLKVKRKVVCTKYQPFIDTLYQASDMVVYE